jgi:hypothetical protein
VYDPPWYRWLGHDFCAWAFVLALGAAIAACAWASAELDSLAAGESGGELSADLGDRKR